MSLRYTATILDVKADGAMARSPATSAMQLQAEVELMFAFLDDRFPSGPLFEPVDFVAMIRAFGMYDVGQNGRRRADRAPRLLCRRRARSDSRISKVGCPPHILPAPN